MVFSTKCGGMPPLRNSMPKDNQPTLLFGITKLRLQAAAATEARTVERWSAGLQVTHII